MWTLSTIQTNYGRDLKSDGLPIEIIDIDSNEDLAREFVVRSVPTTIIMDGDKEIERFVGGKNKKAY